MMLDIVVFAAHPDDAEIGMGGTIAKLTNNGIKVGVIDLSEGELGTRGNPDLRRQEADESSEILNVEVRENLNLPDGSLRPGKIFIGKVVSKIRYYKPKIIFAPIANDRHPDHVGVSRIVAEAMFYSGLKKFKSDGLDNNTEAYRPSRLFYYMQTYDFEPSFIVDISDTFKQKMEALAAYSSQFFNPESNNAEPETFISQSNFIEYIEARAKFYGFKIGKNFGEAFFSEESIELDLLNAIKNISGV